MSTGTMSPQIVPANTPIIINPNTYLKQGDAWKVYGWNTYPGVHTDSIGSFEYTIDQTYSFSENITLYAVWKCKSWRFNVGDIGPANGIFFYVKEYIRNNVKKYTYYECAPTDTEVKRHWGTNGFLVGTLPDFGKGVTNTSAIIYKDVATYKIADECRKNYKTITNNGIFETWNLPSIDELQLIYDFFIEGNGDVNNLMNFKDTPYWSSTEYSDYKAYGVDFRNALQGVYNKYNTFLYGRAIRIFE